MSNVFQFKTPKSMYMGFRTLEELTQIVNSLEYNSDYLNGIGENIRLPESERRVELIKNDGSRTGADSLYLAVLGAPHPDRVIFTVEKDYTLTYLTAEDDNGNDISGREISNNTVI